MTDQAVAAVVQKANPGRCVAQAPVSGSRRSNWRTALVLLSIALMFFAGVIVNRMLTS